jgi:hypothetical protein
VAQDPTLKGDGEWVTVKEAARRLSMSPSSFPAMAHESGIEVRGRSRQPGVNWASVEHYITRAPIPSGTSSAGRSRSGSTAGPTARLTHPPKASPPELRALTELRDTVADLLDTHARCCADNDFAAVQARLNRLYDRYVSEFRNGDQMAEAGQAG